MTTVLVTGCAGFIGSNLTNKLVEQNYDVVGVDNLCAGLPQFVNPNIEFHHLDFTADPILDMVKRKRFDYVFHLAALPRVEYSVQRPLETHNTNVTKTLQLIDACKNNIQRFVFSSSSSIYGNTVKLPAKENDVGHFSTLSPYALQKSIIEQYLRLYGQLYGLESISLRYFNVFGPNSRASGAYSTVVSAWLHAVKHSLPLRFDGDGTQTRDMCYVDNVVNANILSMHNPYKLYGEVCNVGCGDSVSNRVIFDYLKDKFVNKTLIVVQQPPRVGDVKHTLADISHSWECIHYRPIVQFWDGLERTIDWYMNSEF